MKNKPPLYKGLHCINTKEFIKHLSESTGYSQFELGTIVDRFFVLIREELTTNGYDAVRFGRYGSFCKKHVKETNKVDPRSAGDTPVHIPAHDRMVYRVGRYYGAGRDINFKDAKTNMSWEKMIAAHKQDRK